MERVLADDGTVEAECLRERGGQLVGFLHHGDAHRVILAARLEDEWVPDRRRLDAAGRARK